MITILKRIWSLLLLAGLLSACGENDKDFFPVVSISTPAIGHVFAAGETVHIHADLNDNSEVREYALTIKAVSYDSVVYEKTEAVNAKGHHIHDHWTNNLTFTSEMVLTITAVDNDENMSAQTVIFHCQHQ